MSSKLLARVEASVLADKILLLLPVLETRLGYAQTQRLADAFALQSRVPLDSVKDLRSFSQLLISFLPTKDSEAWFNTWRSAPSFWLCGDNPLSKPHNPHPHRLQGPTKDVKRLGARHDSPSPFLVFHFSWRFLNLKDRVSIVASHPSMRDYAQFRCSAANRLLYSLQMNRPKQQDITPLCHRRAWILS